MSNLCGIHDREGQAITPPDTWVLHTMALSENPTPPDYLPSLHWMTRCNWSYGSGGTLPVPDQYPMFAQRVAAYVGASQGCSRWIIGNESNLSREWPDGQPIFPWHYAACYKLCREAIHALPGHEHDEVLIAASGPWNAELKYEGNPTGDWIQYFIDVIRACGNEVDGFAIHSYTHGYDAALVTSEAMMQAPFQNCHYEFRTYRDYMQAIPDAFSHLPVYLTEANGNGPWQAVGLMPAMLDEIDAWNESGAQPILCVIFYRYPRYDDFYIEGKADVIAEYHVAVEQGYQSPSVMPPNPSEPMPPEPTPTPPAGDYVLAWDTRLDTRGTELTVTAGEPDQTIWHVIAGLWFDQEEAQGRTNCFVTVLDENGNLLTGIPVRWFWADGDEVKNTEIKSDPWLGHPYSLDFSMYVPAPAYGVTIADGNLSDVLTGLGLGSIEQPDHKIHTAYSFTFRRMKGAEGTPPPEPTPAAIQTGQVTAPLGLNYRAGPSINAAILGALAYGSTVLYNQESNGFLHVIEGWVSDDWVGPVIAVAQPSTAPPLPQPVGDNWARCYAFIRKWEGGFANNPNDPGGATNKGITIDTLTRWRKAHGQPQPTVQELRDISDEETNRIYYEWYWKASGADLMPWPLCLAHFDTAVNAGVGRAKEMFAKSGGTFLAYMGHLIDFYTRIDNFEHFGRAWIRRRADILLEAAK